MTRRPMTRSRKVRIFEAAGGICHICLSRIDGVRERWDAEHVIPLAAGGEDDDDNLRPAHVACHRGKTTEDAKVIAKTKRVRAKHIGAVPKRRGFLTNKDGPWKARLGKSPERRT